MSKGIVFWFGFFEQRDVSFWNIPFLAPVQALSSAYIGLLGSILFPSVTSSTGHHVSESLVARGP